MVAESGRDSREHERSEQKIEFTVRPTFNGVGFNSDKDDKLILSTKFTFM